MYKIVLIAPVGPLENLCSGKLLDGTVLFMGSYPFKPWQIENV